MRRIILFLALIALLCSCKDSNIEGAIIEPQVTAKPMPSPTASPIPHVFEPFDGSYKNLISKQSHLIVYNNKIYFTNATVLYCFDAEKNEKIEIDNKLVSENIYLAEGFIYYLKRDSLIQIDAGIGEIQIIAKATERDKDVFKDYNLYKGSDLHFTDFFVYGDTLMVECFADIQSWSEPICVASVMEIGQWDFGNNFLSDNYYREYFENNQIRFENDAAGIVLYYNAINEMPRKLTGIYYVVGTITDKYMDEGSSFDGGLVVSKDSVFITGWPESRDRVQGRNLDTNEKFYEKDIANAVAKPIAINQYVLYYYYDRQHIEEYNTQQGVVLIDTKNNEIYENDQINDLLSGGFDYTIFYHADFYLIGNTVYILQNELNEMENLSNMNQQTKENGIYIPDLHPYRKVGESFGYIKFPSKVNLYKAEVIDGKLHITQIYKEFDLVVS